MCANSWIGMLASAKYQPLDAWSPEAFTAALEGLLIKEGQLDPKGLERGRRLAAESGSRLDSVLTQLGLLSERALAEATAKLLELKIAITADYPADAILPDRLRLKFLRKSRAVP